MNFRYKTSFSSKTRCLIESDVDQFLSVASLSELKNIIPAEVIGNGKQDLLPIAGNLALINACNLNDDAMDGVTALQVYKTAINKYINTEHSRNHVCGHIVSVGFSKYNSNYNLGVGSEVIAEEDLKNLADPFNMAYAGVIYRFVCPELAEEILASNDPTSPKYLSVSSSWEVGFNDYKIAVGSRYLKDATLYSPGDTGFADLDKLLRANDGPGTKDGQYVYRVLAGNPIFLGAGLTTSPASAVKGLVTPDTETIIIEANKNVVENLAIIDEKLIKSVSDTIEALQNISQIPTLDVTEVSNSNVKIMDKITEISQITDETLKVVKASTVHEFVQSEILKKNEEWKVKQAEAEKTLTETNEKFTTLTEEHSAAMEQLNTLKAELNTIKEQNLARQKAEIFTARMASFDEVFSLSDEDRTIIKDQIADLSDEAYTKVEAQLKTLLKSKTKTQTSVASVPPTVPTVEPTPSTVVDNAISNAQPIAPVTPNATQAAAPSVKDRWNKAFEFGVGIKFQNKNR
jgi:hypothetical protein